MTINTTEPKEPRLSKKTIVLLILGLLGVIVGFAAGSATSHTSGSSEPAPTKTVTVEVEAPAADDGCREVAVELMAILNETANDVVIPQNEVMNTLYQNLVSGYDEASILDATDTLKQIASTTDGLTERTKALAPDYQECTAP